MKKSNIRNLIILFIFFGIFACDQWDDHYNQPIEESGMMIWDAIQENPEFSDFVMLMKEVQLDTLLSQDVPRTLFIPENSTLDDVISVTDLATKKMLLEYLISNGVILPSQFSNLRKVATLSSKLLFLTKQEGKVLADGIEVQEISPMYQNGVYYHLSAYPYPRLSIEQLIEEKAPSLKAFIEQNIIKEIDWDASTVIGENSEGQPIYDTVTIELNPFYENYFDISAESRDLEATLIIFEEEVYQDAVNKKVKDLLKIDEIPKRWQDEVLFPYIIKNMAFEGRLEYDDLRDTMVNIVGDSVQLDYDLIDPDSKVECSNGNAFFYSEVNIPREMVLDTIILEGEDMVDENGNWIEEVTTNDNTKIPRISPSDNASGGASMNVPLSRTGDEGYYLEFQVPNLFPIKYKLIWSAYYTPSGEIEFTVNGVNIGQSDNFYFRKPNAWGEAEFPIDHLTEYGDVTIRMTFKNGGIYKNSNALFFDCVKLIPIVEE